MSNGALYDLVQDMANDLEKVHEEVAAVRALCTQILEALNSE